MRITLRGLQRRVAPYAEARVRVLPQRTPVALVATKSKGVARALRTPFLCVDVRGHCFWHPSPGTIQEHQEISSTHPEPTANDQQSSSSLWAPSKTLEHVPPQWLSEGLHTAYNPRQAQKQRSAPCAGRATTSPSYTSGQWVMKAMGEQARPGRRRALQPDPPVRPLCNGVPRPPSGGATRSFIHSFTYTPAWEQHVGLCGAQNPRCWAQASPTTWSPIFSPLDSVEQSRGVGQTAKRCRC